MLLSGDVASMVRAKRKDISMTNFKLLASSLALLAVAPVTAQNASPYEYSEKAIEPVEAISVDGAFKVMVFGTSDSAEVTLFGPPELLADTEAVVEEGTLHIRFREGAVWSWNAGSGMHATVKLPKVSAIGVEGPAHVEVFGARTEQLRAGIGGAGRIELTGIEADMVEFGTGGSGSITASGMAQAAKYGTGGSGSIDAKRLRAKNAQIGVGGSGSVYADVSERAEIGVLGSGKVEVVGGATCQFDPDQAKKIECR